MSLTRKCGFIRLEPTISVLKVSTGCLKDWIKWVIKGASVITNSKAVLKSARLYFFTSSSLDFLVGNSRSNQIKKDSSLYEFRN